MKLLYVALFVVAVLAVGFGISNSNARVLPVGHKLASKQDVYVDISKLIKLHPSWHAVETMKSTVADVSAGSNGVHMMKSHISQDLGRDSIKARNDLQASVSRRSLEAEVCKSAAVALQQLESDQWEALQTRLRLNRSTLLQNAESEIKLLEHDVEVESAEKSVTASTGRSNDQINAQMRVTALLAASKSPGVGASLLPKLEEAQAHLDMINREASSEQLQITAQTQEKLQSIRSRYEAKIDAALSIYESGEERRISGISEASRKEVLSDVCIFDALASPEETVSVVSRLNAGGSSVKDSQRAYTSSGDINLDSMGKRMSKLETQIRDDVARAIRQLAADKGMNVVFSRDARNMGVADKTKEFSELMREQAWSICRPILSEAYSI